MKYKILDHKKFNIKKDNDVVFYILPASSSAKEFQIIYPVKTKEYQLEAWHNKKLVIKQFKGCNNTVIKSVKQSLANIIKDNMEKIKSSMQTMLFLGILFVLFGIFDLILPDPLILIDELLIITGGALLTVSGYIKKKNLSALDKKQEEVIKQIENLHIIEDPICTKIYHSIKKKTGPQDMDSDWYIHQGDIREINNTTPIALPDLKNILAGIGSMIPVAKLTRLENRINYLRSKGSKAHPAIKRLHKIKNALNHKYGISQDAITIYQIFYHSAQIYIKEQEIGA
jgi:hypothetical protein